MIKNNKGIALAYVLIIMAVMAILGLVIIQISLTETLQAAHDKNKMQAYYLAKSGVEATAAWMVNPNNKGDTLIGKTSSPATLTGSNINGTYIVSVLGDITSPILLVKGTGTVNGVSATATMSINMGSTSISTVFTDTLYSYNTITANSNAAEIIGNIVAGDAIDVKNVSGKTTQYKKIKYPSVIFPAIPTTVDFSDSNSYLNLTDTSKFPGQIAGYDTFTCGSNLTIYTGNLNNVVSLIVNTFDLSKSARLTITGNGILWVFVKAQINIDNKAQINYDKDPRKLIVFLGVGTAFTDKNSYQFNGFIYAPDTAFSITGNGNITGSIIADTIDIKGNNSIDGTKFGPFNDITISNLPVVKYSKGYWVDN